MKSIHCTVETPKGSNAKYNYDPQFGGYLLAKYLPLGFVFPYDFGFIPGTLGEDGDPLDVIIISEQGTFPGCIMQCRVIGAVKAIQREKDGQRIENDRYLVIPETSVIFEKINEADQLPKSVLDELENFFISYNQQEGKNFDPFKLIKSKQAVKTIQQSQSRQKPTKMIQLLVPLCDQEGKPFPQSFYKNIAKKLIKDFGGVTAYTHAPANGIWEDGKKREVKDQIIIYEVMVTEIDQPYWKEYKHTLEEQFHQRDLIIRQSEIGLL